MSRPTLTPAMRAALVRASHAPIWRGTRYGYDAAGAVDACERRGLLVRLPYDGTARWAITPAGLDALRAEVST